MGEGVTIGNSAKRGHEPPSLARSALLPGYEVGVVDIADLKTRIPLDTLARCLAQQKTTADAILFYSIRVDLLDGREAHDIDGNHARRRCYIHAPIFIIVLPTITDTPLDLCSQYPPATCPLVPLKCFLCGLATNGMCDYESRSTSDCTSPSYGFSVILRLFSLCGMMRGGAAGYRRFGGSKGAGREIPWSGYGDSEKGTAFRCRPSLIPFTSESRSREGDGRLVPIWHACIVVQCAIWGLLDGKVDADVMGCIRLDWGASWIEGEAGVKMEAEALVLRRIDTRVATSARDLRYASRDVSLPAFMNLLSSPTLSVYLYLYLPSSPRYSYSPLRILSPLGDKLNVARNYVATLVLPVRPL
ncbi:hypothetical protein K438DRAFT_1987539 [Mycena galopus ATCC 62051]|nr:hypothetical protein K438DRAFT_1987539 [Mycena galopus ATCC 62051]